jgi:hypothetical protein
MIDTCSIPKCCKQYHFYWFHQKFEQSILCSVSS